MGQINRTAVTFFLRLNSLLMANIRPEFHDGQVNDLQRSIQNGVGVSIGFLWRTSGLHWVLYCVGKTSVTVFCFFDLEKRKENNNNRKRAKPSSSKQKTRIIQTDKGRRRERHRVHISIDTRIRGYLFPLDIRMYTTGICLGDVPFIDTTGLAISKRSFWFVA